MRINWPVITFGTLGLGTLLLTQQILAGQFGPYVRAGFLAFFGIR